MDEKKSTWLLVFLLFPVLFLCPDTTIVKNANLFLLDSGYRPGSYILLDGCKIAGVGLMKDLEEGEIYDHEYDAAGGFVYPAFIDPLFKGFQEKGTENREEKPGSGDSAAVDKTERRSLEERNYFIRKRAVDHLDMTASGIRKVVANGFAVLHVVPEGGIIGGTSTVVSLVSHLPRQAVLVPEHSMVLYFKRNSREYPTTLAGLGAELRQLKEDSSHHGKMTDRQFFHPSKRAEFRPELNILGDYFLNRKRFLIFTENLVEQRLVESLRKEMKLDPLMVAGPEVWRRRAAPGADIILPLEFKPPAISKFSRMGEKNKEKAKTEIYPQKIARFFEAHRNVALAAPSGGDYKTLYRNIRILLAKGVPEADIIRSLTVVPARLLHISRYTGTVGIGMLGNLIVSDKKIFEEKRKIKWVFVEGQAFDFTRGDGEVKPPAKDIGGTWHIKIESPTGNFEVKLTAETEGNDFSGEVVSRMGTMEVQDGFVNGDEVTFSCTIPMGGQDVKIEFSGKLKLKEGKIEGTVNVGSFGSGTFVAVPDEAGGGRTSREEI